MKILITGATGFLGQFVVDELSKTDYEVIIVTRSKSCLIPTCDTVRNFKIRQYELSPIKDQHNLYEYFEQPDLLIHLAWGNLDNYDSPLHITENYISSYYFIENLIHHGLRDIVIVGTCLEYGLKEGCLKESDSADPVTYYGLGKDLLRRTITMLANKYSTRLLWLRLFYMYGKGQSSKSFYSQLLKAIHYGESSFKMSKGNQKRDYLSVEKMAELITRLSLNKMAKGTINCCSGVPITVLDFAESIKKALGSSIRLETDFYPIPKYEPFEFWGDNTILKSFDV